MRALIFGISFFLLFPCSAVPRLKAAHELDASSSAKAQDRLPQNGRRHKAQPKPPSGTQQVWIPRGDNLAANGRNSLVPVQIAQAIPGPIVRAGVLDGSEDSWRDKPGIWHAQVGQDRTVVQLLKGKRGGFFIDLAANEPIILSNSRTLERDFGWDGLCIEVRRNS